MEDNSKEKEDEEMKGSSSNENNADVDDDDDDGTGGFQRPAGSVDAVVLDLPEPWEAVFARGVRVHA